MLSSHRWCSWKLAMPNSRCLQVLGAFAQLVKVQLPAVGAELPKVGNWANWANWLVNFANQWRNIMNQTQPSLFGRVSMISRREKCCCHEADDGSWGLAINHGEMWCDFQKMRISQSTFGYAASHGLEPRKSDIWNLAWLDISSKALHLPYICRFNGRNFKNTHGLNLLWQAPVLRSEGGLLNCTLRRGQTWNILEPIFKSSEVKLIFWSFCNQLQSNYQVYQFLLLSLLSDL